MNLNHGIFVGRISREPEMKSPTGGGKTFLAVNISVEKRWAEKTFTQYVQVCIYGKNIDELKAQIWNGQLVEASGEMSAAGYTGNDGTAKAVLKCVGQLRPLEKAEPVQAKKETVQDEAGGGGVPF